MSKYKLNVSERISLMKVLPLEGNFLTLKVLRGLNDALGIAEADFKKFEIKQVDGLISWGDEGKKEVEVEIGDKAAEIVKETLAKLSEENKLTQQLFSVYEKFIGGE